MTVATCLTAECEVVGRLKEGQYGPYHPCKFRSADGLEFWKSWEPGAQELEVVRKGKVYSFVQLPGKNGKADYKLVVDVLASSGHLPQVQSPMPERKQAIADRIDELAARYAYVYRRVSAHCDGIPLEAIQAFSSGIMITIRDEFPEA